MQVIRNQKTTNRKKKVFTQVFRPQLVVARYRKGRLSKKVFRGGWGNSSEEKIKPPFIQLPQQLVELQTREGGHLQLMAEQIHLLPPIRGSRESRHWAKRPH